MLAMRYGVARGIFSNEAGLGTAGIAQAAGQSKNAARSGLIGMMGTFIDTHHRLHDDRARADRHRRLVERRVGRGAELERLRAPPSPASASYFLAIALAIFAYTTILGWAYYGEKCWEYLVGTAVEMPYRVLWTIFVLVGAVTQLDFVWLVADTLNAFMAFPNLVSLLLLSPVIAQGDAGVLRDRRRDLTLASRRRAQTRIGITT